MLLFSRTLFLQFYPDLQFCHFNENLEWVIFHQFSSNVNLSIYIYTAFIPHFPG